MVAPKQHQLQPQVLASEASKEIKENPVASSWVYDSFDIPREYMTPVLMISPFFKEIHSFIALEPKTETVAATDVHIEQLDVDETVSKATATVSSSIFNQTNTIIGAGILSTPLVFSWNGALLQTGLLFVAALVMGWTAGDMAKTTNYRQLVKTALGPKWAKLLLIGQIMTMSGTMVIYTILVADFGTNVLADFGVSVSRLTVLLVVGCGIMLPLCLLKSLNALRFSSVMAIVFILYFICASTGDSVVQTTLHGVSSSFGLVTLSSNLFLSVPITLMAFQSHVMILPIYSELKAVGETKEEKAKNKRRDMLKVITVSFTLCAFLYLLAGMAGFMRWGDRIDSGNVLNIYSDYEDELMAPWMFTLAQSLFLFVIVFSYPLICFAVRVGVEDLVFPETKPSYARGALISVVFFSFSILIGYLVSDVSIVFSIIGSVAAPLTSLIFPCMSFYQMQKNTGKVTIESYFAIVITFVGIFLGIAGLYVTLA